MLPEIPTTRQPLPCPPIPLTVVVSTTATLQVASQESSRRWQVTYLGSTTYIEEVER